MKITKEELPKRESIGGKNMAEYMMSEARGNAVYKNNCIYIPENYPEEWRKRLEAGEVISYEEDGETCEIWIEKN